MVEADKQIADLEKMGINLNAVTEKLQEDGVKAFIDSYEQLLGALEEKRQALLAE